MSSIMLRAGSGTVSSKRRRNAGKVSPTASTDQGHGDMKNDKESRGQGYRQVHHHFRPEARRPVRPPYRQGPHRGRRRQGRRPHLSRSRTAAWASPRDEFNKGHAALLRPSSTIAKAKIVSGEIKVPTNDQEAADFVKAQSSVVQRYRRTVDRFSVYGPFFV